MIDWGKFFSSFVQIVPWLKTLRYAIGIALIVGVAYGAYVKLTKKDSVQKIDLRGNTGKVTITTSSKRFLIPFIEVFVQKDSNEGFDTGIRAGTRVEF